jgi:hypothetical protein
MAPPLSARTSDDEKRAARACDDGLAWLDQERVVSLARFAAVSLVELVLQKTANRSGAGRLRERNSERPG